MATLDAPVPVIPQVQMPPPTSLNPQATAQLIAAPSDRWTALKQIGWWKPIDGIIIGFIVGHLVTGLFFTAFGRMTFAVAVIGLLQVIALLAAWAVVLIYRCMDFVVQLRANIEMLPFDSARIAVGFMQGGKG